jgi:hypothetical protein
MRRIVPALLLATFVAAALPHPAAATPLYVLDTDEATYTLVHRVNPQTGELTTIGELPPEDIVVAIAAADDNTLYAVSYGGALLRISVSPFGYTQVADVGTNGYVGLAYGNGRLYAVEGNVGELRRINPSTGATTLVGVIRLPNGNPLQAYGGDIVESASGNWFLWTNATRALYRLNVDTAVATPVPDQVQDVTWISGLAFDYATGRLYGSAVDDDLLITIEPSSGAPLAGVPVCTDCPVVHDLAFGDMTSPRCSDADNDGFYAEKGCGLLRDCNDTIAAVNPLARETCNGRDDDCDGVVDDGASRTCSDGNACTIGDSCEAGSCRAGTQRSCLLYRYLLQSPTCRQSDGACCGRLYGTLSNLTVCLP